MNAIWKIGFMSCCLLTAGFSMDKEIEEHLEAIHQIAQQQQVNYEKTIKELNEKNGDLAKNNCELIAQLAKNKEEMKAQLQELKRLSDENKQVAGEYKTLGDTITALNSENQSLKEKNTLLKKKLRESDECREEAEKYLPAVIEKNIVIEQSAEDTKKRLQMTEAALRQAVDDLEKKRFVEFQLKQQLDQAKSAVAQTAELAKSIEQAKISLSEKYKDLQSENESLKKQMAESEEQVKQSTQLSTQHREEIAKLRQNYHDIAAQLDALRNEPTDLNKLKNENESLNKTIKELKSMMDKRGAEHVSELDKMRKAHDDEKYSLDQRLKQAENSALEAKKLLAAKTEAYNQLTEENEDLKRKLYNLQNPTKKSRK